MNKKQFLESGLIEQYVLGLTSPQESEQVKEVAATYPEVKDLIDSLQNSLESYINSQAIPPPSDLKGKVLSKVYDYDEDEMDDTIDSKENSSSSIWKWLGGLGLLLGGILAFTFYQNFTSLKQDYNSLEKEYVLFKEDCDNLRRSNENIVLQNTFLKDENTLHVHLRGSGLAPEALAVVFWNKEKEGAYLKVVNLPKAPQGKEYQLWADIDGKMVNMCPVKAGIANLVEIPYMAEATSLNVTLEDEGQNEHATVSQLYINGKV